jgi:hypothetical protein
VPGEQYSSILFQELMPMEWNISESERVYLRELARKQSTYAALPIMGERKRMWQDLNDARPARPPVIIETWTFDRDFLPDRLLRCSSPSAKGIEKQLLRNIRNHELINDDKVIPDTFDIGWFVDIDELGVPIGREVVPDAQGVDTGFRILHPITDLQRDFDLLKPARCSVDREKTLRWQAFLNELFGDLLPVHIRTGPFGCNMLTYRVIELMGMEAFFMAMIEQPEMVHKLMAFLRDNSLRVMKWAEDEGLLRSNSGNQVSFGSSPNFTSLEPADDAASTPASLSDMWGCANSQETVGVSPTMYNEFCFPYYREAVAPLGHLYYGCCEPVHSFWKDIRQLPHLKKVSIPRWCDQRFMGEALRGTDIVFSRKPDPNFLGVDETLNEAGWSSHIHDTLEATRGVAVEFIIRDVYTVHGNLDKPRRAVELARQLIDACFDG